eukprot:TRINITY_DN5652_c0_g1_i7.p2 TRINITY_DN5652_c0_g1~~TRINITY_DN5652_c0_g1_i7.p2  ORF type:complete len:125 (+),score=26.29 TRINITY_DN5652_c0_g1_i7:3-377(+)
MSSSLEETSGSASTTVLEETSVPTASEETNVSSYTTVEGLTTTSEQTTTTLEQTTSYEISTSLEDMISICRFVNCEQEPEASSIAFNQTIVVPNISISFGSGITFTDGVNIINSTITIQISDRE